MGKLNVAALAAIGILFAAPVMAQDQAGASTTQESAGAQSQNTARIENVIVRARKREETQQSTPVTLTAISGPTLERQFVTTLSDVRSVPNIQIQYVGQFRAAMSATIRGIGYGGINSEIDPEVAVYVDGAYFTRNTTALLDLFDVESIEVLRGPQGTLFGRNALAGAINVRSKRPTGEFGVEGAIRAGNYGRIDVRAAIDIPLVKDKVAARIAFLSQNSDGYFTNAVDHKSFMGDDLIAIRPSVKFTPSDNFQWTLIGEFNRDRGDGTPNKNASRPNSTFCTLAGLVGDTNCGAHPWSYIHPGLPGYIPGDERHNSLGDPYTIAFNVTGPNRSDIWGLVSEAIWDSDIGTFTSITSYRHVKEDFQVDSEGDVILFFNAQRPAKVTDFSQELRYENKFGDLDLMAGVYYLHSDLDTSMAVTSIFPAFENHRRSTQKRDSFAAFLDLEYHFTDALSFEAGLRYSYEKKDFTFGAAQPPGVALTYQDLSANWSDVSPHVALHYNVNDDVMLYASWSRGFKSGGFNSLVATAADAGPYQPEKVDGFEIGMKGDFLDDRLRVNLAGFWQLFSGLQRQVVLVNGATTSNLIVNAADATTRGVELEITAVPVDGLRIHASAGYLDAYYTDFCSNIGVVNLPNLVPCSTAQPGFRDLSALNLTLAPKFNVSIGVEYTFEIGNAGSVTLQADYTHESSLETDTGNAAIGHRRPTDLVNASINWEHPSEKFGVSLFARNLFNEIYTQSGLDVGGGIWSTWIPNPPRTWGVELKFKFD
jgi:iron complex outermembrane receptor protein